MKEEVGSGIRVSKRNLAGKPILVAKNVDTGFVTANMVTQKGVDGFAVTSLERDIGKVMGFKRVILRSDQEPTITALKEAYRNTTKNDVMIEETPVGDSKAAGEIESTIKQVEGMVRTYKLALEARIGAEIPEDHNIIPWLIKHAAASLNRYNVGKDGLTPYRRLRGKNFRKEVADFGESVWYLKPKSLGKRKLVSRWASGIWLGIRDESNEVLIGTTEGVIKVRTVRRKGSPEERWDTVGIDSMKGIPWELVLGDRRQGES